MDMRNEPAWATHARRIDRGDDIRINRDDDEDEGADLQEAIADDGTADRGGGLCEKDGVHEMYPRSDSEQTRAGSGSSGSGVVSKLGRGGERSDADAMERGEYTGTGDVADERMAEVPMPEERNVDASDGRTTPPLAQYREGHHLVIERKTGPGEEVSSKVFAGTTSGLGADF